MNIMKIVMLAAVCILCATQCMYATDESAKQDVRVFTGKVDSTSPIDSDRGVESSSMIVIDANGKTANFIIDTKTKFLNANSDPITSGEVEDGDTVNVEYVGTDEGSVAISVNVI